MSYSIADIVRASTRATGVTKRELRSHRRQRELTTVRHAVLYLCRELTERSYPQIGNFFDRDHTSVIYADRRAAERLKTEREFREIVWRIRRNLTRFKFDETKVCIQISHDQLMSFEIPKYRRAA